MNLNVYQESLTGLFDLKHREILKILQQIRLMVSKEFTSSNSPTLHWKFQIFLKNNLDIFKNLNSRQREIF